MKKIVTMISAILCLLLVACSNATPNSDYETTSTNVSSPIETSTPTPKPTADPEVTDNDRMSELDAEAKRRADNAKSIKSGDIYNAVTSIYENIELVDMEGSLHINIYLDSDSPQADSEVFFYLVKKLIAECNFESEYDTLNFSMYVDDSCITMFSVLRYYGPDSYTSVEPFAIFDDNYKECFLTLYNDYFLSSDIDNNFEQELQRIGEKYDID